MGYITHHGPLLGKMNIDCGCRFSGYETHGEFQHKSNKAVEPAMGCRRDLNHPKVTIAM
jgi:hypothetical protein